MPLFDEIHPECLDGGRLPHPGHPGNPHAQCVSPVGREFEQQLLCLRPVILSGRLHQGDGPGQTGAVSRPDQCCQIVRCRHQVRSYPSRSASLCNRPIAASEITVPGGKMAAAPAWYSSSKSPGGITPPTTIMMSGRPASASA
ncbi:Uncharacterised protein [Mycobacteroides abscessus subsp. abscessus]|nr:Uncharacterised protein [Mycobacteroides abscessus subsp. abscessus]